MTAMSEPRVAIARPHVGGSGEPEHSLVTRARRVGAVLEQTADESERERRLPPEAAKALTEAGFFRLCRPHHLGGLEADPPAVLASIEELARHDGSAAWCALNSGIAGALHSFLPPDGALETGRDDAVVNGVIAPSGRATERDGGHVINGRWSFASNCHHCTWLVPASIVFHGDEMSMTPDGPEIIMTFLEAGEWRIIDTWHTVGLRGTGSHDIEVVDTFVPAHRTIRLPFPDPVTDRPLYRFPLIALFSIGFAACALGIARAAIDDVIELAGSKTPFGTAAALASRTTTQLAMCDAIARVRSARALLCDETTRLWEQVQAGADVAAEQRAALRLATTHATAASAKAVDVMYTVAGGTSVFTSSPLQRRLRDVHAITQHFFVAPPTYETIGRVLLGVEPDGFML
jgi:alkylation response protein AidB-like acyl-CoA dehydrogenase